MHDRKQFVFSALVLLASLLASVPSASACSCTPLKTCGLKYADVDVIGLVLSKRLVAAPKSARSDTLWSERYVYQIQIEESFSADTKREQIIEVTSGTGGADCSYLFDVGKHYFVDAHRGDSQLFTSLCTRTGELQDRLQEIKQLRRRANGERQPDLSGAVYLDRQYGAGRYRWATLAGTHVTLHAADGRPVGDVVTDSNGLFRFDQIPKGYVQIGVENLPSHQRPGDSSLDPYGTSIPPLWIDSMSPDFSACRVDLDVYETGSISGKIVGPRPSHGISVEVFEVTAEGLRGNDAGGASIEDDGTFRLSRLPRGSYLIVMKTEYWPGQLSSAKPDRTVYGPEVRVTLDAGEQKTDIRLSER